LSDQIGSTPGRDLESFAARLAQLEHSLAAIAGRIGGLERNVAALGKQVFESQDRVEADVRRIQSQLEEQTATLASSRAAVAQTDDLVELVVEALESLQSNGLEQPESPAVVN
jgi:uncharacterized coiled-coil protein SlyX